MQKIYILVTDFCDAYYYSSPLRALNAGKDYLRKVLDEGEPLDSALEELNQSYTDDCTNFGVDGVFNVHTENIDMEAE